jgi:hypothetical protein
MDVAEVGREPGQVNLDVDVCSVPAQERAHRESMTNIVKAWPSAIRRSTQTHPARQLDECLLDGVDRQTPAILADEEARRRGFRKDSISLLRVPFLMGVAWRP